MTLVTKRCGLRHLMAVSMMLHLSGCALSIDPPKQSVSVQTFHESATLTGVTCELSNDRGLWTVITPGTAEVTPSKEDLLIRCNHTNKGSGVAHAVARPSAGYLSHPAVNLAMPVVAVVEPVKELAVGISQAYPKNVQVIMDRDIIVTATQ